MPEEKPAAATKKSFPDAVWNLFASLKLVILLLLILSALSIAGTIIEQNQPLNVYYKYFQPGTVALLDKLGLLDMYHSWWFITCLALLALNIIACTMDRYQSVMAGIRKRNPILDQGVEKSLNPLTKEKYALSFDDAEKKILDLVGKRFSRKHVFTQTEDGSRHYFFERGKYTRLAFFFTHLSVLIIFIGAIVGSLFGYKGYITVFEGQSVSAMTTRAGALKDFNFAVKCNSFTVDFYPNGMPKDYRSNLSIVQNGKDVLMKTIRVNDPLTFAGISFYQSSYGSLPDTVDFEVVGNDGSVKGMVQTPFSQKIALPGTTDQIEVADYQEHFHLSDGSEGGPALGVNIYPEKGSPLGVWLFENNPDYDKMRQGPYFLRVKNVHLKKYTGLQVNKDPGEWLVWLGCLLLIGGIMTAFFLSHKKLWVSLKKDKKGRMEVAIGGTTNKNRPAFAREVEGIIQQLKESIS